MRYRVKRVMKKRPAAERFFSKVEVATNGCWLWTGATSGVTGGREPYGQFWDQGRNHKAHRWAYETFIGPIPPDLVMDHRVCDQTLCVRPDHLNPSTQKVNVLRGKSCAARNARKTRCPKGHPLIQIGRQRDCVICKRERDRVNQARYRAQRKAKAGRS